MKFLTLTKLGRTLLLSAAALAAVCWLGLGCDKNGGNPAGGDDPGVNLPKLTEEMRGGGGLNLEGADSLPPGYYWNTRGEDGLGVGWSWPPRPNDLLRMGGVKWMVANVPGGVAPGWYCYDNAKSGDEQCYGYFKGSKGALYKWKDAVKACENLGMRLPTRDEWRDLIASVCGDGNCGWRAGYHLKEYTQRNCTFGICTGNPWHVTPLFAGDGYVSSDDLYGFAAPAGGHRDDDGKYYAVGYYGDWWSSTRMGPYNDGRYGVYSYRMGWDYHDVKENYFSDDGQARSVRCVQDEEPEW